MYKELIVASTCILWYIFMFSYMAIAAGQLPVMVL